MNLDGLPAEYAQGIYATPGRHDALARFSNGSPHAGADAGLGAVTAARLGHRGIPGVEFTDVKGFLLLNLAAISVFAILVAAAWYFRRNAQVHKRLMLMSATGALIGPGVSRLPFFSGNTPAIGMLVLAFLFAGPAYDLVTRRRIHPAYIWAVLLSFLTVPPVVAQLSATAAWHSFAGLLLR